MHKDTCMNIFYFKKYISCVHLPSPVMINLSIYGVMVSTCSAAFFNLPYFPLLAAEEVKAMS